MKDKEQEEREERLCKATFEAIRGIADSLFGGCVIYNCMKKERIEEE